MVARKGMADAAATDTGAVREGFFSNDERQVFSGQWFKVAWFRTQSGGKDSDPSSDRKEFR